MECVKKGQNSRQKLWLAVAVIFIFSLAIRVVFSVLEPLLSRDACLYMLMLERWQSTGDYQLMLESFNGKFNRIPPFSLWLMQIFTMFGLPLELSARSMVMLLGSGVPICGGMIARTVTGKDKIAFFSALLLAVHPELVELSVDPTRDTPYLFFAGWTIFFMFRAIESRKFAMWGIAGAFAAASLCCRYEGVEFIPIAAFALILQLCFKEIKIRQAAGAAGVWVCSFAVCGSGLMQLTGSSFLLLHTYLKYYSAYLKF